MRILHKNIKISKILFSKTAGFLYLLAFLYLAYVNFKIFPMWLRVQERLGNAKTIYENKLENKIKVDRKTEIINTDQGQKRYRKEFFNEVDEGEQIIILYGEKEEKEKQEEIYREMNLMQKWKQKTKVWWANK
jgi:hypothetical protein